MAEWPRRVARWSDRIESYNQLSTFPKWLSSSSLRKVFERAIDRYVVVCYSAITTPAKRGRKEFSKWKRIA